MTDRFSICLPFTLAQECPFPKDWSNPRNFSKDAHDPGGETMCGITQREYDAYRKHQGIVCRDVRQLDELEGEEIYEWSYWKPHCILLPPGLDLPFFDASVNEGCLEAVRILQHVLTLDVDGLWGPKTAEWATRLSQAPSGTIESLVKAFTTRRIEVYHESKGFPYFGKDWLRRAKEIGDEALRMVNQ